MEPVGTWRDREEGRDRSRIYSKADSSVRGDGGDRGSNYVSIRMVEGGRKEGRELRRGSHARVLWWWWFDSYVTAQSKR
jgi:hypothetical protein